ncbi:TAXI family TRAP transporter solute-binding subunit [Streptomyces cavernae]|uniref:TAXI family TRAP transporter solute-binding subunit n=1 Tax=Streptomyces cavernae TaxID=2259034 RepID=UPI000FEBA4A4|nr:TAXI family TRAP transporter solute-binding subunit [Streptomyces cavernae]
MPKPFPPIGRRRALQGSAAAFVAFGLLLWWLLPIGERSPGGDVTFSTGSQKGVYQQYGGLLKDALAEDMPSLDVRLWESEGSQENVERVATGQADFTIAAADAVAKYRLDQRSGWGRLRGCARLYDDYVQLVVPRASSVHSVADLEGKKVAIGQPGSGVRLISERILVASGLDPNKDIKAVSSSIATMSEQLRRGEIAAFFWSGGLPTGAVASLAETFDIRLVPLGGDLVEKLHKQGGVSVYYRAADIPADAYKEVQEGQAVQTVAVANILVTRAGVDTKLTERFTRTVIDSRDSIGQEVHSAQLVDLRTAIYTDPLELHEGAARYYRSVKP